MVFSAWNLLPGLDDLEKCFLGVQTFTGGHLKSEYECYVEVLVRICRYITGCNR